MASAYHYLARLVYRKLEPHTKDLAGRIPSPPELSAPRQSVGLLDLQEDIILEIFFGLDVPSILALRRTNTILYAWSKLAYVWSTALRNFTDLHPHLVPRLEQPLCTYRSFKLEKIVINLVKLEKNWTSDIPKPIRVRDVPNSGRNVLLPGGRWLLSSTHQEELLKVLYYDLDAPNLTPQALIQTTLSSIQHSLIVASPDIPHTLSTVSYDLVISYFHIDAFKYTVWRISLGDTGGELFATQISSFASQIEMHRSISAREGMVAQITKHSPSTIHVFQWSKCTDFAHCKAMIYIDEVIAQYPLIQLLPYQRILVIDISGAAIYDIPESLHITAGSEPPVGPIHTPCWSIRYLVPVGFDDYFAASPAFRGTSYLFIYNGSRVYCLRVPTNGCADFFVTSTLSRAPTTHRCIVFGENRAVLWNNHSEPPINISCISYNTRHSPTGASDDAEIADGPQSDALRSSEWLEKSFKFKGRLSETVAAFDDQSGRVVMRGIRPKPLNQRLESATSQPNKQNWVSLIMYFA
ncbi:hypothetical protein FRB95_005639 [Tulasnella sp. JGI-2019a]|nr:hypothetical protein FRB95_005639 [Tulasnella sp. JGI-2019a]